MYVCERKSIQICIQYVGGEHCMSLAVLDLCTDFLIKAKEIERGNWHHHYILLV